MSRHSSFVSFCMLPVLLVRLLFSSQVLAATSKDDLASFKRQASPNITTSHRLHHRTYISPAYCEDYEFQDLTEDVVPSVQNWASNAVIHTPDDPRNEFDANIFLVHFQRHPDNGQNPPSVQAMRHFVRDKIFTVASEIRHSPYGRVILDCEDLTDPKCDDEDLVLLRQTENTIIVVSVPTSSHVFVGLVTSFAIHA